MEFQYPVSNLTFFMIGVDSFFNQFGVIDVYRNGAFHATFPIFGNGTFTVGHTLGSITDISKIVIRNLTDPAGVGFDDFTFTIPWKIRISNSQVNGFIEGTTQNALPGANITLLGTALPTAFSGGIYSWSLTGPVLALSATNNSSVTFRSIDVGTITATLTYTKDGVTKVSSVNINSVLPTLATFTAVQGGDFVTTAGACNAVDTFTWYRLGCLPQTTGINFTTTVNAPSSFISNPAQSGIKYVQALSSLRKWTERGLRCLGIRSSESDVESGWQLDTSDPYDIPKFFSAGNSLTMTTVDFPKQNLTFITSYEFTESAFVDDQFWMYVIYFAGENAGSPILKKTLGRLRWNWGGLVVFDPTGSGWAHNRRFTNAVPQSRTGEPATSTVNMQGEISKTPVPCPGGPPLTENRIDSSRTLVKYYYLDILLRPDDQNGDEGWKDWTSVIAQCVFDMGCIQTRRANTALGFFFSGEFIQRIAAEDPIMANPPGTPNFNAAEYNRRFVYWCYKLLLKREPDQPHWDNWTNFLNSTGNYAHVVFGFIYSNEYRERAFS